MDFFCRLWYIDYMMAKKSAIIKAFFLTFFVISCASSSNAFRGIDVAVSQTDFASAIAALERAQSGRRPLFNERNSISLFMDLGLLQHFAGNHAESSAALENAERLIQEAYTRSITQGFLTFIINDNMRDYPGEDFEDIYINVFNALNYYHRGDMEGALVEIRKLTTTSGKLNMLARRHEFTDPNTGVSLSEMTYRETGIRDLPETRAVNFSNSALARYLSALFYQAIGDMDSARIEFDQIYRAFSANRNVYRFPVPASVEQARNANIPDEKARLNIITFAGLSPIKEEQRIMHFLPFRHPILAFAHFKLPVLVRRPSMITSIEVIVEGHGSFNLELIEDISAVVEETYNGRFSNILLKTYIRTIMKYTVADLAILQTRRQGGEGRGLLTAIAARTALEASESADIRMTRFLPGRAYIGGINLDPGTYSVIINYYHGNNIIYRERHSNVIVNRGGLNLLQSVNLK